MLNELAEPPNDATSKPAAKPKRAAKKPAPSSKAAASKQASRLGDPLVGEKRATARRAAPARPARDLAVFGAPVAGASHFSVRAQVGSKWVPVGYPNGDGLELREWPVAELSLQTLRNRWGDGTYFVQWLGFKDGRRVALGRSQVVRLTTPGAPAPPPAHAAPAPLGGGLAALLGSDPISAVVSLMGVAQKQADGQIAQVRDSAARSLEQERSVFILMMKQQEQGFAQLLKLQQTSSEQQIERLEERLEELVERVEDQGDDDDETPSTALATVPGSWGELARALTPELAPKILEAIGPGLNEALFGIGSLLKARSAPKVGP